MLNNIAYFPGDSVFIDEIGDINTNSESPGSTLVCVTDNVNNNCCRENENQNGAIGQWFFPNSTIVPRPNEAFSFSRRGHDNQVRLAKLDRKPRGPTGVYRCEVPDVNGKNISAYIMLSKFNC